jgi:hypothetical protein
MPLAPTAQRIRRKRKVIRSKRGHWRTNRLASRSRLDTAPLQFALDGIEKYLKREHGERRPTDDRGSRQDQKSVIWISPMSHSGKPPTNMTWSWDKGIACLRLAK